MRGWWKEQAQSLGARRAASLLLRELWGFLRESTPEQRRQRYGDMDYDWEHRVNTTSGGVGWQTRLLGVFHTAYQPTDPAFFHPMMADLPIDFREFTFIDIGSGKGRTLLMASEYAFRKIVGVELIEELHRAAEKNMQAYHSPTQQCSNIQSVCTDARNFELPTEPLVLYLFNPLPEGALRELIERLEKSLAKSPRRVWVVYHNPVLEPIVANSSALQRARTGPHYSVYRSVQAP